MGPKDRAKNAAKPTLAEIKAAFPPESVAFFRAEVQRGGRIGIPIVERKQLGIDERDTVNVLLMRVGGKQKASGRRPQKSRVL